MRYSDDSRFEHYYLEDSWVLGIKVDDVEVVLDIVLHLRPTHPHHTAPKPEEWACYKPGRLCFREVINVDYRPSGRPAYIDLDGSRDYGNIDAFDVLSSDQYALHGDWGSLNVVARAAFVELTPAS